MTTTAATKITTKITPTMTLKAMTPMITTIATVRTTTMKSNLSERTGWVAFGLVWVATLQQQGEQQPEQQREQQRCVQPEWKNWVSCIWSGLGCYSTHAASPTTNLRFIVIFASILIFVKLWFFRWSPHFLIVVFFCPFLPTLSAVPQPGCFLGDDFHKNKRIAPGMAYSFSQLVIHVKNAEPAL